VLGKRQLRHVASVQLQHRGQRNRAMMRLRFEVAAFSVHQVEAAGARDDPVHLRRLILGDRHGLALVGRQRRWAIDDPTDADLLEGAVRKLGGLVRRIKAQGAAPRTRFRDRGRAAGRRMKQLADSLRRHGGRRPRLRDHRQRPGPG
jgi:hypothetical protein